MVGTGGSGATISSSSGVMDNGSLIVNHADAVILNRPITGTGSLTQTGSGILLLTNSNSYTGATAINGGTLEVGGSIASSSILDNASLVYNIAGIQTYSGAISGSGSLVKLGSGKVTLSGVNAFSGPTQVSGGAFLLGNSAALESSTFVGGVDSGLTFMPGIGTFTLGGLGGSSNLTLADTGGAAIVLQVGSNGVNSIYSGSLRGSGSLIKIGSGELTLAGLDRYTGGTEVDAGTLTVASLSVLPDGTSLTVAAGGVLDFNPSASGAPVAATSISVVAAVPEPATFTLLMAAALLAVVAAWQPRKWP